MSRIKGQDGGEPEVPEVWGEALGLHTPAVWASLVEGAKEAGPGRGPGGQGQGRTHGGRSLDAQVRGKGRMQRAQGRDRVQLGSILDLLG